MAKAKLATIQEQIMQARRKAGLCVLVYGLPGRDKPFDYYASNEVQRDEFAARYARQGYTVEIAAA